MEDFMKHPLILYFSSEIFLSTGLGIVLYALPFYYVSHHATYTVVGILFAVNAVCGGLAALLLGPVADRIGASKVWKWSSAILPISYLLTCTTHALTVWLFTVALTGLSGSLLMSTENVVLSSLSKTQEKSGILSKFVAMYMFVMGAGSILSGQICAEFGFQTAIIVGALVSLCAMPFRLLVRAPDTIAHRAFRLPSRRILAMSGYACLFGAGSALLNQFATLIVHNQFGLSTGITSWVSAAATFMVSLGAWFVSTLIGWLGKNRTLLISYLSSIGITAAMALTRNSYIFSSFYLGRTATTAIPGPIVDAIFLDMTPATDYSQMFGVRVFGTNVGTAVGSYFGGVLLSQRVVSWIAVTSALVFIVAGTYLLGLLRRVYRLQRKEPSHQYMNN